MTEPRKPAGAARKTPAARRTPAPRAAVATTPRAMPGDGLLRVVVEDVRPRVDDGAARRQAYGRRDPSRCPPTSSPTGTCTWAPCCATGQAARRTGTRPPWRPRGNDVWQAALRRSSAPASTSTRWKPGSIASRRGATSSRGRRRPGRMSPASCSRARRWCATRARTGRRPDAGMACRACRTPSRARRRRRSASQPRSTPSWRPRWPALPDRTRSRDLRPRPAGLGGSRASPVRRLVRVVPALGGHRSDAQRDARARRRRACPHIAAMGFDVVYLPPVHPIGRAHRKGPNNALARRPRRPREPVGDRRGRGRAQGRRSRPRHARRLRPLRGGRGQRTASRSRSTWRSSARRTIPTCASIPDWFRHRPDGTIKYAENPPKKYQDIYPVRLRVRRLARALGRAARGRPVLDRARRARSSASTTRTRSRSAFWDWLIAEVQREHPGRHLPRRGVHAAEGDAAPRQGRVHAVVLATSPGATRRHELTEYFTELTQTDVREYMRPNLFANTPGHPARVPAGRRAGGVPGRGWSSRRRSGRRYGIYGPPFELCDGARRAGHRGVPATRRSTRSGVWDHDRPGHIRDLITRVNRARREHPALQYDHRLRFHPIDNDAAALLLEDARRTARTPSWSVVNLDPHHVQHGWVRRCRSTSWASPTDEPYRGRTTC